MTTDFGRVARRVAVALLFTFGVSHGPALSQTSSDDRSRATEWRGVEQALRLVSLDRRFRVALIDPDLAAEPATLAGLDAFIVRETGGQLRPVIYLNRRSAIVQRAAAGDARAIEELAAVIHHEMRHLAGDSEADARRAEREFLQSLTSRHPARYTLLRCAR